MMYIMSSKRSGAGQDDQDNGSWASETLPMSVRKEMLERELKKLGFRRADSHASNSQQQQQPQGESSSHPQAGGDTGGDHSQ
jgi:hypothetical protein